MAKRIILGGGQLASLMLEVADRVPELELSAWSTADGDPVRSVPGARIFTGTLAEAIRRSGAEGWIAESEFIEAPELEGLSGTPDLSHLTLLRDKESQKRVLDQLKIPTATWFSVPTVEDVPKSDEWVLKQATLGYDGKGNELNSDEFLNFWKASSQRRISVFAERRIPFVRELARIFFRDTFGNVTSYPLVETHQQNGVCYWVHGPILEERSLKASEHIGLRILDELKYTGCLAIEFFETADGELLVNELAPRVHNSGHYSIDLGPDFPSQFENQLRIAAKLPLRKAEGVAFKKPFLMMNLLGPFDLKSEVTLSKIPALDTSLGVLHWYHKPVLKAGRKMGHLFFEGESQERNLLLEKGETFWEAYLKSQC